jgi:soluble lytic murein transglycosylase
MRSNRHASFISILVVGLLAAACNIPLIFDDNPAFGPTPEPTESPTASPTASPSPTPTPLPEVRLEEGDWALFNGDWDRAIDAYRAALHPDFSVEVTAAAQLGLGTAYLRAMRYGDAALAFGVFVEAFPNHPVLGHGYFLRAQAYEALGDMQSAIQDYDRYLELRPGLIDAFVHERVGDALREIGLPNQALVRYQASLDSPRTGSTAGLRIKIGNAHMEAGQYDLALAMFDEVYSLSSAATTRASMNLAAGRALEAMGDADGALARYFDSVQNYPSAYSSYLGLIELVEAEYPVDEIQRGLVDYYAGVYQPALNAFNRYLAENSSAAAYYYRGLTLRQLGDNENAILDFQYVIDNFPGDALATASWLEIAHTLWPHQDDLAGALQTTLDFVAAYPTSPDAPEALYDAGRLAERSGNLANASQIWLRAGSEYPSSSFAYWGSWESGFVLYRLGDYGAARESFLRANGFADDSGKIAATQLWVGKTYAAQGDLEAARAAWELAAAADPLGYYAIRAQDLLAGNEPFASFGIFDFSTDIEMERLQADAWMRLTFGVDPEESLFELDESLLQDERMIRGEEFWALGMFSEGRIEFASLQSAKKGDPIASFRLIHKYLDLGLYSSAISIAITILDMAGFEGAALLSAPPYFTHIRYGPYFGELILLEAFNHDLNGLFLYSVARWESGLFNVFATSYADARGLMQVIPSTGQEIAGRLGWPPNYTAADLYRPIVSMRFGAYYLAQQRDYFDGDLYAALAAYNAGAGNASIWKELAPDDPDLFLEVIRLNQPHLYIRRIYESYAIYRTLYTVQ